MSNILPSLSTSYAAARVTARGNVLANGTGYAGNVLAFSDTPASVSVEGNMLTVTGDYAGINVANGSTRTTAVGNTIGGSSSVPLVRQLSAGTLYGRANTISNGGAGGLYGTSGTAVADVPTAQADSTASDVAGLLVDFNALLAKLRASGALAP